MGNRLATLLFLGLTASCGPCGGEDATAEGSAGVSDADRIAVAVAVVRNVEANPQLTAVVLEAAGLTVADFQDLMAEIASDETLRNEYIAETGE